MILFFNGWGFALEPEPQTGQLKLRSFFPYIIIIIIIWKLLLRQSGIKQGKGCNSPLRTCNSETKRKYI